MFLPASSSLRWFLWFILSLFWLRGIKLSSSQNSWNLLSLSPSLRYVCFIWERLRVDFCLLLCIFIANANELVGKSCVIKFYFSWIRSHARNAMFFPSREPKTKKLMHETKSDGNGRRRRRDDNAFCASLSLDDSHSRVSLRLYCRNLHFYCDFRFDWLSRDVVVCLKKNPIIIQWSCIPRNYFPCYSARCRRRGEMANEIVGEMNMFCGRSRVTSFSRVQEGFQLWSFLVMQISRRIRTGECFLSADFMWLKTPTTPTHVFSPYGTCCAWYKHISTISPADSRNWASIMRNFLLTSWKQREISTKVFLR